MNTPVARFATLALLLGGTASFAQSPSAALTLTVDASDLSHRLIRAHETIPVTAGPLKLWYPQWLPGTHSPRGPIEALAGPSITGNGQPIEWTRSSTEPYAFQLTVPEGVSALEIDLQYATPMEKEQGRIVMTPEILGLQWNAVLLYPAAPNALQQPVMASLRLPAGWDAASALEELARSGDTVAYQATPLGTLIDSPVMAGRYSQTWALGDASGAKVRLTGFGDSEAALAARSDQLGFHAKLLREAEALFGSRHFEHYDFLLAVSDRFGAIGLEHQQSSENAVSADYFAEWDKKQIERSLLAHEYTHSWCGKFRRPAGLLTPDYNTPMQNDLLWVYEGQTQYWGQVLAARSGLWSQPFAREAMAYLAATLEQNRPGRSWRNLQDTVNQPVLTPRRPLSWTSWQRGEDYYGEGLLLWLDVDTQLRALSNEAHSLDTFARSFFGVQNGSQQPLPYRFDDLVAALNAEVPFDWTGFLKARLQGHTEAPLQGLTRAGWKLAFIDRPSEYIKGLEDSRKLNDLSFSLGLSVEKDGNLAEVIWGSPAFKAGLSKGDTLIAVNGIGYKPERLLQAVREAHDSKQPIELLLKNLDHYRTVRITYTDGLRYPVLVRIDDSKDRLTAILASRVP